MIAALHALGAVPVVNENDATATDEISLGDNDALAAQVAILARARLLVLLTEAEGVFTRAPGEPGAEPIGDGAAVEGAVFGKGTALGSGGMESKVAAAQMAVAAGITTVIAGGTGESVLGPIVAGEPRGTRFAAEEGTQPAFKLWLRFGTPVVGRLHVDEGARARRAGGGEEPARGRRPRLRRPLRGRGRRRARLRRRRLREGPERGQRRRARRAAARGRGRPPRPARCSTKAKSLVCRSFRAWVASR